MVSVRHAASLNLLLVVCHGKTPSHSWEILFALTGETPSFPRLGSLNTAAEAVNDGLGFQLVQIRQGYPLSPADAVLEARRDDQEQVLALHLVIHAGQSWAEKVAFLNPIHHRWPVAVRDGLGHEAAIPGPANPGAVITVFVLDNELLPEHLPGASRLGYAQQSMFGVLRGILCSPQELPICLSRLASCMPEL